MSQYIIGIDVSKNKLDAFCSFDRSNQSFDNNEEGIKQIWRVFTQGWIFTFQESCT